MRFFKLRTLGQNDDMDLCFVSGEPEGEIDTCDLSEGLRLRDEYPDGLGETTHQLDDDHPGLLLPDFIGNTDRMLICSTSAKEVILAHDAGEVEVVPFTLLNHRGRVHSRDYVFVNPVGAVDCLNLPTCDIFRHDDGSIGSVDRFVVDVKKVESARDLFRPQESRGTYIFSEKLVSAIQEKKLTNFVFQELEVK
jgi:hypothetical protein